MVGSIPMRFRDVTQDPTSQRTHAPIVVDMLGNDQTSRIPMGRNGL